MTRMLLTLIILLFGSPQKQNVPPELLREWTHSHEEDGKDVQVFRPQGYHFPPSRGRIGFEIKKDGEFVLYDIAPADGSEKVLGRWTAPDKNKIQVRFDDAAKSFTMSIISLDKDILKVKIQRK
jgi:hypothetical protein